MYTPLARALVGAAPLPVTGRRVLDLGAGTGVAGRAALAAGAHWVVSADLAVAMLSRTGPAALDPARLAAHASAAGFTGVRVRTMTVPTGLSAPVQLASWRLGLAQVAPFLQSLDAGQLAAARRAAEQAVAGTGPLVVSMLVLTGR